MKQTATALRTRLTILAIIILFMDGPSVKAQAIERFNTFNYSVNEGLLQSTIGDMAYDKNNFCWISFSNGIQKFDGREFTIVPVQPGLPDDNFVKFLRCLNGDLLISHSQGISKYEITGNRFIQVYTHQGRKKTAQFIGEDEHIIYFYTVTGDLIGIDCRNYRVISTKKTGLPNYSQNSDNRPSFSRNIIDHKIAIGINSVLYWWDLKKGQLIGQSQAIKFMSPFFFSMKSAHEVLYFDYITKNALQLYDFNTKSIRTLALAGKEEKMLGRCNIFPWQNRTLIAVNEHLYELDTAKLVLGTELVNFQNQPIGGNIAISKLAEDNFGNLCISTVTAGIKKIIRNNYPVRYYGTLKKDDNNNIISVLPDKKNNRILAGTSGNGLLVFDTLQHLVKHIPLMPGNTNPTSISCIIKDNKGNYLLF
ncbi:MAG: hypothetical protein ABIN74_04470, partial [Ferruginibacter sp.]